MRRLLGARLIGRDDARSEPHPSSPARPRPLPHTRGLVDIILPVKVYGPGEFFYGAGSTTWHKLDAAVRSACSVSLASWRKPVGMLAIIALIALWAVLVGSLSGWIGSLPVWAQVPVYVVLGIVWIWLLPLRRLLAWMETGRWHRG